MESPRQIIPFAQILLAISAGALAAAAALAFQLDGWVSRVVVLTALLALAWAGVRTWRNTGKMQAFNLKANRGVGLLVSLLAVLVGVTLVVSTFLDL